MQCRISTLMILLVVFTTSCAAIKEDYNYRESENIKLLSSQPPLQKEFINEKLKLLQIVHGGWVSKAYLEKVNKQKSIYSTLPERKNFAELIIDTNRTFGGDTIGNPGCLENDEEMNYLKIIFIKDSLSKVAMKVFFVEGPLREDSYMLGYGIFKKDTTLNLFSKNTISQKLTLINDYVKIFSNPPGFDYQINPTELLNFNLFLRGEYKLYSTNNSLLINSIIFDVDETINGFKDFTKYYLGNAVSSSSCGTCHFDYIVFYKQDGITNTAYHWKAKGDTIELYNVITPNIDFEKGNKSSIEGSA